MPRRDEFSAHVKRAVAQRVGYLCSAPSCGKKTVAAKSGDSGTTLIGVAAHIKAAAEGGARYDPSQSTEDRKSLSNAIWLCSNDAALIDRDPERYPVALLRTWKSEAEERSRREIGRSDNKSTGQTDTAAGLTIVIAGERGGDVVGGYKIVFEAPAKEPLPHWLHRPGGPMFRLRPGSHISEGVQRLLMEFEITASPLPAGVEARWVGEGVGTDWAAPMVEPRSTSPDYRKFQMKPLSISLPHAATSISLEIQFHLDDGQHVARWTWPVQVHEKGHWVIHNNLGSGTEQPKIEDTSHEIIEQDIPDETLPTQPIGADFTYQVPIPDGKNFELYLLPEPNMSGGHERLRSLALAMVDHDIEFDPPNMYFRVRSAQTNNLKPGIYGLQIWKVDEGDYSRVYSGSLKLN